MAPAAERLSAASDGLRLLSKLEVLGGVGTDTRQTARGCTGGPWSQSGAERWNYRQPDGKDDRKGGIRGYDGGKRTLGRKRHIVVDVLGLLLIVMLHSDAFPCYRSVLARPCAWGKRSIGLSTLQRLSPLTRASKRQDLQVPLGLFRRHELAL
jgi:hypothetical protein